MLTCELSLAGFVLLISVVVPVRSSIPLGCTALDNEGHYECDFRVLTLPVSGSAFSTQPQYVSFIGVSGTIPARSFKDLATSSSVFPLANNPKVLSFTCLKRNAVILETNTFKGLDWVDVLSFTDCEFTIIPDNVFEHFSTLDTLDFIGGSFGTLDSNTLAGLSIARDSSLPQPHGRLTFEYTSFPGGRVPADFFAPVSSASEIQLIGNGITSLDSNTFGNMTQLTTLALSGNEFIYLPLTIFDGFGSLTTLYLSDIPWNCSACGGTWFIQWAYDNFVTIEGSLVCDIPPERQGTRMKKYQMNICGGVIPTGSSSSASFDSQSGMYMGEQFVSTQDLVALIFCFILLIIGLVNIGLITKLRKSKKGGPGTTSTSDKKGPSSNGKSTSNDRPKATNETRRGSKMPTNVRRKASTTAWGKEKGGRITPSEVKLNIWDEPR